MSPAEIPAEEANGEPTPTIVALVITRSAQRYVSTSHDLTDAGVYIEPEDGPRFIPWHNIMEVQFAEVEA